MRVLKVEFNSIYSWYKDPGEEDKLAAALAKQAARAALIEQVMGSTKAEPGGYFDYRGLLLSQDQYFEFVKAGDSPTILEIVDIKSGSGAFSEFAARQHALPSPEHALNNLVHVHVAGQVLSSYNRVQLLPDSCTDALQDALDNGWRIIAACVQPDGRRPDYIMGRFEPK